MNEQQQLNKDVPRITIPDFLWTLSAMHFNRLVPSPVQDAGGMMLNAPSGSLKSQLLMHLQRTYPTTCICDSNWHFGKLVKMRSAFYNNTIRSIIIPELSSIYAGDPRTGGRMEAMLQQMAGEGSIATNERDSRWERYEMRASVFAAMTPEWSSRKHQGWEQGFHRRFLWAYLAMENEEILLDYLTAGKQADLYVPPIVEPPERFIPDTLTYEERMFVRSLLANQKAFGPNHTRFSFLCRTAAVLKWHFARVDKRRSWRDLLLRFSACLSDQAALLVVPDEPISMQFRKIEERKQVHDESKKMSGKRMQKQSKRTTSHRVSKRSRKVVRRASSKNNRHTNHAGARPTQSSEQSSPPSNLPTLPVEQNPIPEIHNERKME